MTVVLDNRDNCLDVFLFQRILDFFSDFALDTCLNIDEMGSQLNQPAMMFLFGNFSGIDDADGYHDDFRIKDSMDLQSESAV